MQIVIDIPEVFYEYCKRQEDPIEIQLAIKNGTPLPSNHGRLIILSEDKLKENLTNFDFSCNKWINLVSLSNATVTIIEPEKRRA